VPNSGFSVVFFFVFCFFCSFFFYSFFFFFAFFFFCLLPVAVGRCKALDLKTRSLDMTKNCLLLRVDRCEQLDFDNFCAIFCRNCGTLGNLPPPLSKFLVGNTRTYLT
jgi:hypothetical protein